MKTFFKFLTLSILFASCGDADTTIYEGGVDDQTYLSFSSDVYTLPIVIDATGSVDVVLNSSNVSSVDRTYVITIIANESTADPLTYNVPGTVTIPAGSYQGFLTVTGQDLDLVETTGKPLVITFTPINEEENVSSTKATINVLQVCPIPEGFFQGEYLIEQTSPENGFDSPAFDTQIVTIDAPSEFSRSFSAIYIETAGGSVASSVVFNLACGEVSLAERVETNLFCEESDPQTFIDFGPALTPGSYDVEDDSEFTLRIREFPTGGGSCGTSPIETTLKFTKQ